MPVYWPGLATAALTLCADVGLLALPANRTVRRPTVGCEPPAPGGSFGFLSAGSGSAKSSAESARAAWFDVPTSSRDSGGLGGSNNAIAAGIFRELSPGFGSTVGR
jgi:hypothetical protein